MNSLSASALRIGRRVRFLVESFDFLLMSRLFMSMVTFSAAASVAVLALAALLVAILRILLLHVSVVEFYSILQTDTTGENERLKNYFSIFMFRRLLSCGGF